MSWDVTTPVGNENKTLGATRIREGKTAQETALQTEGIFPGANPAVPIYIPTIPYGPESSRPASDPDQEGRWYYNTTTQSIQRDTGSAWENVTGPVSSLIPTGTNMVFFEASAPTGWTQVISGIDDRLVRVASTGGVAVSGQSVSTPPTHTHNTGNASDTTHKHSYTISEIRANVGATAVVSSITLDLSQYSGSASIPHVHSLVATAAFSPKYIDVIICVKN